MDDNEVIIYGFRLGNSDPDFQEFVRSMSNEDVHNLRKILYQSKLEPYQDGIGAAMYGKDRYGLVAIPESIKKGKWKESENELYSFIKDLWVASVLGYTDPGINPIKIHQWKITRIRATTSKEEGWAFFKSAAIELALSYVGRKGLFKFQTNKYRYTIKPLRKSGGKLSGFSISKGDGYGAKPRFDFEEIKGPSKPMRRLTIPEKLRGKPLPHYHRGKGDNLRYHRPWELGSDGKRRW